MADQLVQDLLESGIHFGQKKSAWNPKMKPYIWGARNKIHIIDIRETIRGLMLAKRFIAKTVQNGKDVCFVGTKRQARDAVQTQATDVNMPWVVERWLGGTLTNFRTIRERLKRLIELEGLVESGERSRRVGGVPRPRPRPRKAESPRRHSNPSGRPLI